MLECPAWCDTPWGMAATLEVRLRLGARPEGAPSVTQAIAVKEAEDVLKCYNRRGHELNDDLRAEEDYVREPARREVAALKVYISKFGPKS